MKRKEAVMGSVVLVNKKTVDRQKKTVERQ